ncbi:MAG TPA: V-type ATP synthase subunit I [Candidatus Jeotgalibaca pullicola]|nr:V-type ATP synthase subunit I [Candidatus Jeotgalibaca pullicola]
MAIAKMNKIKIISLQEQKEMILQTIQGMESIELIDMSAEYKRLSAMSPRKRDKIDESIKLLENRYEEYRNYMNFMQDYFPKQPLLGKMREKRQGLTIQELERETKDIDQHEVIHTIQSSMDTLKEIKESLEQMKESEEFLLKWKNMSYVPHQMENNKFIRVLAGTIPQTVSDEFMRSIRESDLLHVEEIYQTRDEYGVTVVFDYKDKEAVLSLLETNHFFKLNYLYQDTPTEELKKIENEMKTLIQQRQDLQKTLTDRKDIEWKLKLMIETVYARLQRVRGELLLVDEPNLFILEGWMEKKKVHEVQQTMQETLSIDDYAFLVEEVKEEEIDKVPIVLENNKYIAPFETITEMYSLPKYNEIDPTPFLMPFYLVFFGMMMADAGYGLMMFLATTLALKFFTLTKSMQKNMRFFQMLGCATIVWGIIYGSFFGLELPIVPLSIMDDVNTILVISVVFGVIQILLGLGIKTYLLLKEDDKYGALSDGIGWLTIFAGIILLVLANLVFPNATLSTIGTIIALAGVVIVIVASALASANKALGVGIGLYNLYGITGYVGDIVSYTRLMALGVSGGSIGLAFNMIIDFLPTGAKFTVGILLFIVLHLVNIGLSALSAYVHGARLIFVEFFGKFYEGGGKALKPLKTSEEYIDLKNTLTYKMEE